MEGVSFLNKSRKGEEVLLKNKGRCLSLYEEWKGRSHSYPQSNGKVCVSLVI